MVQTIVYEDIVFAEGEDAHEPLSIVDKHGLEAVVEYLSQWHEPGKHDIRNEPAAGLEDWTHHSGDYILTYNLRLGYIGLEYRVEKEEWERCRG